MKNSLLTLLIALLSITAIAQKKDPIKESFWGATDAYSKVTEVPEKYKNESAVVIYKNENYDYHKFGKSVTYTSSTRKRIKLQDIAAVKEFSEFSFSDRFTSNKGFYTNSKLATAALGIKIIKPDGKEIEIDINKEAVKEDNKKKIAIANLEIGDIIDFYYHSVESFQIFTQYAFAPVETTLGETYPTLNLKIVFNTENDFFVNFNSYNGAPELKEITTGKRNDRQYELEAKDITKNDFPMWFLPLVELPCYKFQVFFMRSGKYEEQAAAFLSEKESIIKKTVSKEDIFNYYDKKFYPAGDLRDVNDFLKDKKFESDEEKIKQIYYFARHEYYTKYIEAYAVRGANIMDNPFVLYPSTSIFFNSDEQFIKFFMQYLKKNDIEYEIIIATGKENGPISDILIQSNAQVLLKVNTATPIYFGIFDPYSQPNQFNSSLENTTAYALQVTKNKKVTDIVETKIPSSTDKDNVTKTILNVSLDVATSTIDVEKNEKLFGYNKTYEYDSKVNFYDYVAEDYEKYGTTPLLDLVGNKKSKAKYKKEYDAFITNLKEKQLESLKVAAERDYSVKIEDYSFKILNTGRYSEIVPLEYEEKFKFKDQLLKKAGNNIIVEIGKLIEGQIEITEKEKKRENNIYMNFPRSFEYTIVFKIPEGYTVSGAEKLVKNVTNETGSFVSTYEIKGNELLLSAKKSYKNYFEPVKNWSKMVDFLDAAYQLTQEKILLKKQ